MHNLPLEHIKLIMIFQSGHGWCKNSKRSLPVSEHWINNRKEKPKNICDNNKDLIEYHKNDVEMQEQLPLEEKLNLQNFMVSWGTIPQHLAKGLHLRNLCEYFWR